MANMPKTAKRYLGYKSYSSARAAWAQYQTQGILPPSIQSITPEDISIANGLREEMVRLRAAQDAAVDRLPPPSSPLTGPSRQTSRSQSNAPATANAPVTAGLGIQAGFWVVFGGFAPGVYSSRYVSVSYQNCFQQLDNF